MQTFLSWLSLLATGTGNRNAYNCVYFDGVIWWAMAFQPTDLTLLYAVLRDSSFQWRSPVWTTNSKRSVYIELRIYTSLKGHDLLLTQHEGLYTHTYIRTRTCTYTLTLNCLPPLQSTHHTLLLFPLLTSSPLPSSSLPPSPPPPPPPPSPSTPLPFPALMYIPAVGSASGQVTAEGAGLEGDTPQRDQTPICIQQTEGGWVGWVW